MIIEIMNQIDDKYLNEKMNFHEDYLIFFLLSRKAYNFKDIDRIFYIVLEGWNKNNKKIGLRVKEKNRNRKYLRCNSLLNFIEFTLNKTKNNFYDKKIAFFSLNKWFLSYWCRYYNQTMRKAINISNQFLKNEFIEDKDKEQIKLFLKEINHIK